MSGSSNKKKKFSIRDNWGENSNAKQIEDKILIEESNVTYINFIKDVENQNKLIKQYNEKVKGNNSLVKDNLELAKKLAEKVNDQENIIKKQGELIEEQNAKINKQDTNINEQDTRITNHNKRIDNVHSSFISIIVTLLSVGFIFLAGYSYIVSLVGHTIYMIMHSNINIGLSFIGLILFWAVSLFILYWIVKKLIIALLKALKQNILND